MRAAAILVALVTLAPAAFADQQDVRVGMAAGPVLGADGVWAGDITLAWQLRIAYDPHGTRTRRLAPELIFGYTAVDDGSGFAERSAMREELLLGVRAIERHGPLELTARLDGGFAHATSKRRNQVSWATAGRSVVGQAGLGAALVFGRFAIGAEVLAETAYDDWMLSSRDDGWGDDWRVMVGVEWRRK